MEEKTKKSIERIEKKEVKDRTEEEHYLLLIYKYKHSVRDYLLSMGDFKDVPIEEDKIDVERNYILLDPANVMAMGKIQNFEDEEKPLHLKLDFERDNTNVKVYLDIVEGETFTVWKENKIWGKYSKEYYDQALEVAKAWKQEDIKFYIHKKKNQPILMACDDLGFLLAPRVDDETENGEEIENS